MVVLLILCYRYGLIEGKKDKFNFYTINIPVTRSDRLPCYVSQWDSNKFLLKKTAKVGTEVVSAFAVRLVQCFSQQSHWDGSSTRVAGVTNLATTFETSYFKFLKLIH